MLSAISTRVPSVSSESYADDATLHASTEAPLQEAVDIIALFCDLTGMRLNVAKTMPAGTVQQRRQRPFRSTLHIGTELFPTTTTAKVLGVHICTSSRVNDRTCNARLEAHTRVLDALSVSPLPFERRCEIACSNIISSALSGCQYVRHTQTSLKGLRTGMVKGTFGTKNPSRNVTAVLTILAKGHRADPRLVRPYRILCSLFDTLERLPRLQTRLRRIIQLYREHETLNVQARLGPVGVAVTDGLPAAGITFDDDDLATASVHAPVAGRPLLEMPREERHHVLRSQLRQSAWRELVQQRPSFDGVQHGVDYRLMRELRLTATTPALRRALTVIPTGGTFFANRWGCNANPPVEHVPNSGNSSEEDSETESSRSSSTGGSFDERVSSSTSNDEIPPASTRLCQDCTQGVPDTAAHLWWECPAYTPIRDQPRFAELMQSDRSRWPTCTRLHGVLTTAGAVNGRTLHELMGTIYMAREEAARERARAVPPAHAWVTAASQPAERHAFDFSRLPDAPPRWAYGDRLMRALKGWLTALRWTSAGEVSNIELAVDFETFTGLDVPNLSGVGPLAVNQRGKTMWTMLSALCRICEDLQLPMPLPAERANRVGCLRTLGAPLVWGGLSRRPHFAGGEETSRGSLKPACLVRSSRRASRGRTGEATSSQCTKQRSAPRGLTDGTHQRPSLSAPRIPPL